jgi:mono/diheme cytochrome c family protein
MNRFRACGLALVLATLSQAQEFTPENKEFFENKIRPVLAQNCFACHTNSQMGGLRLDSRDGLLKGGKSGAAIVPGEPEKSLLITAIRQNTELKMPKDGHLTEAAINDLATWVKDGAVWPEAPKSTQSAGYAIRPEQRKFWSFQPLKKPDAPKTVNTAWPLNNIDRFILARLEKEGMKPVGQADRRTLLRRLSYDLTGLPPTFEEVQAFENDKSPNAYEKVVDRLLGSPQYGEMWARHWLDVTRYAEDDYRIGTYERMEKYKFAYTYRDWVIEALNSDMPFDKFVKAQLAADIIVGRPCADVGDKYKEKDDDAAKKDQAVPCDPEVEKERAKMLPALGFNGLGVWSMVDNPPAIERADEWHDKVDSTTKALLGLTVGCARCHDHKYDPIPQKDYYRLAGVFASSNYHPFPLAPKPDVEKYDGQKKELDEREKKLKEFQDQLSDLLARVLMSQTEDYMVGAWRVGSEKRATVESIAEQYKLDPEVLGRWVRFLKKNPSNYTYLVAWQKMITEKGDLDQAKKLAHEFYLKIQEVDKEHAKVKTENEERMIKLKDPEEKFDRLPNGIKRKLIQHQIDLKAMDREASYLWSDLFDLDLPEGVGGNNGEELKTPGLFKITEWSLQRRMNPEFAGFIERSKADIEAFKKAMPVEYPVAMGLEDLNDPTDLKIFVRGNPYTFGDDAPRAFLSILSPEELKPFSKGSGRREFAEEVVKQPIALRVIVNRIWRWNMGTGIVDTPNNFGFAGERPTNPELLDYLTTRFVEQGMSWKKLTKEIVMSRTYQLSSAGTPENAAKDGANRLYSHANRRRMEAEGIWDGLLTAAGSLDTKKVGGASEEMDAKMVRRGVYGAVSRVFPNEFQTLFDYPIPTFSAERRYTTNVALQRLFFLNNEFVHKQSFALAERVKKESSEEAQIRKAFEIVYQRDPTPNETDSAVTLLHDTTVPTPPPASDKAEMKPESKTNDAKAEAKSPEMKGDASKTAADAKDVKDAKDSKPRPRQTESPLEALCWALLSSNEFLFLN